MMIYLTSGIHYTIYYQYNIIHIYIYLCALHLCILYIQYSQDIVSCSTPGHLWHRGTQVAIGKALELPSVDLVAAEAAQVSAAEAAAYAARGSTGWGCHGDVIRGLPWVTLW
jgi:hypothetical protein